MVPVKQFLWKEFLLKHNPTEKGLILEKIPVSTVTFWKEVLWNNSIEKRLTLKKAVCDRKKIQQVEKAGNEVLER